MANESENGLDLLNSGSQFISFLIYPLVKMGMNYFFITLFFSLISLKGFFIYLDLIYEKYAENYILYFLFLFMIPSLHFWTSFISKEALVFYLMAFILSNVINKKGVTVTLVTSIVLLLLIRPYLFFIVTLMYSINWFLEFNSMRWKKAITILAIFGAVIAIGLPIVQNFLRLDTLSFDNLINSYNKIILYSQNYGNSSIDLNNSNYVERLILVLFRPFFVDSNTIVHLFVSIENLFVWAILIKLCFCCKIKMRSIKQIAFPLITSVLLIMFYSIYMYNMGLASRMRVMFLPYLFFTIYYYISVNKKWVA